MTITDENDITTDNVRALRRELDLSSTQFWSAINVLPQTGINYEKGRRIPGSVRRLLFLHHIAGLRTGMSLEEARSLSSIAGARSRLVTAANEISDASDTIRQSALKLY